MTAEALGKREQLSNTIHSQQDTTYIGRENLHIAPLNTKYSFIAQILLQLEVIASAINQTMMRMHRRR